MIRKILAKIRVRRMLKKSRSLESKIARIESDHTGIKLTLNGLSKQISSLHATLNGFREEMRRRGKH